jgi:CubicO group peptidase (beta-lactamase class C family)
MTVICALRLAGQGRLDLDAPVAKYWPEFGQTGKEKLPVRYLLSHRAGLPAVSRPLPPEAI